MVGSEKAGPSHVWKTTMNDDDLNDKRLNQFTGWLNRLGARLTIATGTY